MLITEPIFCETRVIIGAAYHLAPVVIGFPFFHAFKMPFAIQLQYDLIYRWNVLLITALTAPPKIHLHLFVCQLGSIARAASAFGLWKDYFFFASTKLPFLVLQPKHPRLLALKAYKCTYLDQEMVSLCLSLHCKRGMIFCRDLDYWEPQQKRGVIHGNKIMELFWTTVMAPCVCLGPLCSM